MPAPEELELVHSMASEFVRANQLTPPDATMDKLAAIMHAWIMHERAVAWSLSQESLTADMRQRYTGRYNALSRYMPNPELVTGMAYTILTGKEPPRQVSGPENMTQAEFNAYREHQEAANGNKPHYGYGDGIFASPKANATKRQYGHEEQSEAMKAIEARQVQPVRYNPANPINRWGQPGKVQTGSMSGGTSSQHGKYATR